MKTGDMVKTCDGKTGVITGEESNRVEYRYGVRVDESDAPLWYFKSELTVIKNGERNSNKTPS